MATTYVREEPRRSRSSLRVLWFFLIGWHVTLYWVVAAWILNLTIIGMPLGLWMLNRVPLVLTLRMPRGYTVTEMQDGRVIGWRYRERAAESVSAAGHLLHADRLLVQPDLGVAGMAVVRLHYRAAGGRADAQPPAGSDDVDATLIRKLEAGSWKLEW